MSTLSKAVAYVKAFYAAHPVTSELVVVAVIANVVGAVFRV